METEQTQETPVVVGEVTSETDSMKQRKKKKIDNNQAMNELVSLKHQILMLKAAGVSKEVQVVKQKNKVWHPCTDYKNLPVAIVGQQCVIEQPVKQPILVKDPPNALRFLPESDVKKRRKKHEVTQRSEI